MKVQFYLKKSTNYKQRDKRHFRKRKLPKNKLNAAGIYQLKINKRNTRTRCEICPKLPIKTTERRQLRRSVVFAIFEQISHIVLVFILLTSNKWWLKKTFHFRRNDNPLVFFSLNFHSYHKSPTFSQILKSFFHNIIYLPELRSTIFV